MDFFPSALRDTFPENWPDALHELAFPSVQLPLSVQDTVTLGWNSRVFRERMVDAGAPEKPSPEMLAGITAALEAFPEGVMPRIGLCSWKASTLLNLPLRDLRAVMARITADDPRIGRALSIHAAMGEGCVLHLRAWREIAPEAEFRLFLRDGAMIGASQYYYRERFEALHRNRAALEGALQGIASKINAIMANVPLVADVCIPDLQNPAPVLIEVNIFDRRTDPCLYRWDESFDGRLRLA